MPRSDFLAFLAIADRPLVARFAVVDGDGVPHTVPLWYAVDGDDIVMISHRATRKVDHLLANPRASICIGGGERGDDGSPGFLLKGTASVEPDDGYGWLRRITLRYQAPDVAERSIATWRDTLDIIVIRLRVDRVVRVY